MGKRRNAIAGILVGATLILIAQIVGYCGYRMGMNRAHTALSGAGITSPGALSSNIDTMLYSLIAGCVASLIGLVILVRGLIASRRARCEDR